MRDKVKKWERLFHWSCDRYSKLEDEIPRLRARIAELEESERWLRVMKNGLEKWKDELQARVKELEKNQLKPGEVRAKWVNQIEPNKPPVLVEVE